MKHPSLRSRIRESALVIGKANRAYRLPLTHYQNTGEGKDKEVPILMLATSGDDSG